MGKRGRPSIFKNRKTTTVNLESEDFDYLQDNNLELSDFVRKNIEAHRRLSKSPKYKLQKEIEETKEKIKDLELLLSCQELKLQEMEEAEEREYEEGRELREFEDKRREYIIGCTDMMQRNSVCTKYWTDHLLEVWKFSTVKEAKLYVKEVWIEVGVPEKRVKQYLMLN